jgi:hypothetical protein
MDDGVCTNQAESFFSRLRRMVGGQHHKVSAATYTPTPLMPLGWKTLAASTTALSRTAPSGWRLPLRRAGCGPDGGSGPKRCYAPQQ